MANSPADQGMEVAFAGRSNAGKSSAINTLTNQKSLARISKTPGRTQHLNYFELDESRRLVDLPGYGYAKVPQKVKKEWQRGMEEYLQARTCLRGLVLVMDVRRPLTEFDCQMVQWGQLAELPIHLLLTKADKFKRGPAMAALHQTEKRLKSEFQVPFSVQLFSSLKRTGIDQAHQVLDGWLEFNS